MNRSVAHKSARAPKHVAHRQQKRRVATAPRAQPRMNQPRAVQPQRVVAPVASIRSAPISTLAASRNMPLSAFQRTSPFSSTSSFMPKTAAGQLTWQMMKQSKRDMSVLTGIHLKTLVPCDPRFPDDEVISVFNTKLSVVEPVIVAVAEPSFEWVFSSPPDLHTFDVIPVVKDCVDPENPAFEAMEG